MFKLLISIIFSLSVIFTSVSAEEISDYKVYGESYVVIDGNSNEVILSKMQMLKCIRLVSQSLLQLFY